MYSLIHLFLVFIFIFERCIDLIMLLTYLGKLKDVKAVFCLAIRGQNVTAFDRPGSQSE